MLFAPFPIPPPSKLKFKLPPFRMTTSKLDIRNDHEKRRYKWKDSGAYLRLGHDYEKLEYHTQYQSYLWNIKKLLSRWLITKGANPVPSNKNFPCQVRNPTIRNWLKRKKIVSDLVHHDLIKLYPATYSHRSAFRVRRTHWYEKSWSVSSGLAKTISCYLQSQICI